MANVYYSPQAAADLYDHTEYIARDSMAAASKWVDLIEATCETIARNPAVGQVRETIGHGSCRSFVQGNYVIFFRGVADGVEIIRIVRGERDIDRF